jgi:hypothetical protein
MPKTIISGRIVGLRESSSRQVVIKADDNETTQPLAKQSRVGRDGRFQIELEREISGQVNLTVADERGHITQVGLEDMAEVGEVVVVLPDEPEDPRDHVTKVQKLLQAEREALASARQTLAAEIDTRSVSDEEVRDVVNGILSQLAAHGGGDLAWKVKGNATIPKLTERAVKEARTVIDGGTQSVIARQGVVQDGEELTARELVSRLTGGRTHRDGFWRADPLERERKHAVHAISDGLPRPLEPASLASNGGDILEARVMSTGTSRAAVPTETEDGRAGSNGSEISGETIQDVVKAKVRDLVEAIRLPEDPPLLVADSAVKGTSAEVEFVRGVSDVTAFHDIHELVLAMPNIWQDVFDQRFVQVLEAAVYELATVGLDIKTLNQPPAKGQHPAKHLFQKLQSLQNVSETSSANKLQPRTTAMLKPAAAAIATGITDSTSRVLYRMRDDSGASSGGRVGDGFFPETEPNISDMVAERPPIDTRPALLRELLGYLSGKHAFTIFAADGAERAINFALLLTWRQLWKPLNYQAGEIVHTMTLAPGAEQTIITRRRRSLKKYTAEADKSQSSRNSATTDTSRAESEILRKANTTTNFQLTSEGSTKLLVSDGSFTTSTTRDVGREGNDTRRRFREAVMKAAQEYREEHSMEVKTEAEDFFEEETTTKFRNPNDEIVLNVVFYSLQRRYQIQEHLYRARPVILVAMPVPDPSEITSGWIIRYAWIIRRSLLDDRFRIALDYLTTSFLGDQEVLADLRASVYEHTKALKEARYRLAEARALVELRGKTLSDARKKAAQGDTSGVFEALEASGIPVVDTAAGLVDDVVDFVGNIFGSDDDAEKRERVALLIEAAEDELLRAERESREAETQVTAVTSALQQATRDYVQAKRDARNHEVRIAELRVHLSDNILYYMQAIWASVPPDQLFFELHNVRVPILNEKVRVTKKGAFNQPGVGGFTQEQFSTQFVANGGPLTFRSLAEVARLEPIGFKGNMLIFEMYEGNALTDRVLAPYLDESEILRDPNDIAASWTMTELREYADMIRAKVVAGEITQEEFDTVHAPFLRATLERLLSDPGPSEEVVIAPANSVFAELLVTGDSLLEPFKQEHRALDVAVVRSELRRNELDNARRAARIGMDDYEDPDIEAKYLFEGDGNATIISPLSNGERRPSDG